MPTRRQIAAFCGRNRALRSILERLPSRSMLLALNYHRIGRAEETPYDPGVFSATAEELDDQVRFLKRRFHVASLDEAIEMLDRPRTRGAVALLTFDDGYLDNYENAFPVLAAHGVQGVFFLPTAWIGTGELPLWDSVAFIVKASRKRRFRLPSAPLREFDLDADGAPGVIQQLLNFYKSFGEAPPEAFLSTLEEACEAPRPSGTGRVFMNWEEASAMARRGMAFGSHTHTHPVLSRMEPAELEGELKLSKKILEERLNAPARALAYPFGLPETVSPAVFRAAENAGYAAAFSFHGGLNMPGRMERFNLRREAVCLNQAETFHARTALMATTARAI